jgi:flagellar biosynthetic protein FliP
VRPRRALLAAAGAAAALIPAAALAQSVTLDLGGESSSTARIVQIVLLMTVLSLAPAILVTITSFTRIIVVLSFLRNALGIQQTPPNVVMISLALFLTGFVMAPTLQSAYRDGLEPLMQEKIGESEAAQRAMAPLHAFMMQHVRTQDLQLFADMAKIDHVDDVKETPLRVLVPSFMISELRRCRSRSSSSCWWTAGTWSRARSCRVLARARPSFARFRRFPADFPRFLESHGCLSP